MNPFFSETTAAKAASQPTALPLLLHSNSHAVVAWRGGRAIPVVRFLADVAALAETLPQSGHVLNICSDRYRFAVGLAAAIVRCQISVLPPSHNREMVRQIAMRFPDAYCLTDRVESEVDLPQTLYPARCDGGLSDREIPGGSAVHDPDSDLPAVDREPRESAGREIPQIDAAQIVACVFTSGSTGQPRFHFKRWGAMVENVRSGAERLAFETAADTSAAESGAIFSRGAAMPAVVGTVPSQHMFGFESTVLLPWQTGAALVAERPFFPADVHDVLARVPAPRVLVTTPFHLRTLLSEQKDLATRLPELALILSATAPLTPELARKAEALCRAPLIEIFGTTETGQIASRRTARTERWRTLGGVRVREIGGIVYASGGHVSCPADENDGNGEPLSDLLDLHSDRSFTLAGRSADMVNIAGKRSSLGYLNLQLNSVDGVIDGSFFMPDVDEALADGVSRLTAFVVAPGLTAESLLAALRKRVDPVFLPRPLHFVDALPRNATGKLTRAELCDLANRLARGEASAANAHATRTGSDPGTASGRSGDVG